eukprot:1823177-Karenia_brevis.AAC.1
MANGKLPRTTLMNFSCAACWARGAPGNDNCKWQATSHFSMIFRCAARQARGASGNDNDNGKLPRTTG